MAWETDDSSGLLHHFIGTVQSSKWTTDATKQDPNSAFLQWEVSVDDALQSNFQGEVPDTLTVNITIGKDWVEDEAGEVVEHKDGLEMFKGSSAYGKIIGLVSGKSDNYGSNAEVMDGDGPVKVDMKGLAKYMQANKYEDPRQSGIWQGLTFEFRGIGFRYRNTQGDPYAQALPVRFIGEGAVAAPASSGKAEATVERDTLGIWTSAGADDETAATLADLANKAANHTAFAKDAVILPAVQANDDLKAAVLDASVFE